MAEIIKRGEILRVDVFPSTDGKKGWMARARDANGKKLTFQIDADKLADAIEEAIDRYDLPACRDDFGVDTRAGWAIWERAEDGE